MAIIYRTIIISETRNNLEYLVYGHIIDWEMTPLDYNIGQDKWHFENIKGPINAIFIDLDDLKQVNDLLTSRETEIKTTRGNRKIILNYEHTEERFLSKTYGEKSFNPFISYCSNVKYYFSENTEVVGNNIRDYLVRHAEAFSVIENEFSLPLAKHPYMLSTFAHFTPTRLLQYISGYGEPGQKGYEVSFLDEFNNYNGASVELLTTAENNLNDKRTFNLANPPDKVATGFVPDYFRTEIKLNGKIAYLAEAYFIKSINVEMRVISGKIRVGDNLIDTAFRQNFTIEK